MIYTIVLSLLLTFPALSLIEILHVKKFTKLWTIIMVIFGCLSFNLEVFFLNIIVSYTFAFITAIIYYYVAIYQSVKKEMWNEIARELYDSKEDLEQTRCLEIKQYLKDNPNITHWVAVDDLNMGKTGIKNKIKFTHDWGLDNFVLTPRGTEGIKQFGVKEKILNFLK